jgi:hypothetical protein
MISMKSSNPTPQNPGHIKVSTKLGAAQSKSSSINSSGSSPVA